MWQQGNMELNTAEAFKSRFKLRHDPRVLDALQFFWETAIRSVRSGGNEERTVLDLEGYSKMMRRVIGEARITVHVARRRWVRAFDLVSTCCSLRYIMWSLRSGTRRTRRRRLKRNGSATPKARTDFHASGSATLSSRYARAVGD
jgi:hypothetical protein